MKGRYSSSFERGRDVDPFWRSIQWTRRYELISIASPDSSSPETSDSGSILGDKKPIN
jgi:hypothetical protein